MNQKRPDQYEVLNSEYLFYTLLFQEGEEEEARKKRLLKSAEELAIEHRKREVEEELGEHLKDRYREHERHKIQEHEQHFKALLVDLVSLA